MKKLTAEQAQWLIDKINDKRRNLRWDALGDLNTFTIIEEIINQCIEKEFPEFEMKVGCEPKNLRHITIEPSFCNYCVARLVQEDEKQAWHFQKEQFKQFTEGCVKICDWLKGQE